MAVVFWFFKSLFFLQLAADAVDGVHFEDGSDEQEHHPLAHYINNVRVHTIMEVVDERGQEEVVGILYHEQSGNDKADVGQRHDAAQATDDEAATVVLLLHLHGSEGDGTECEDPRGRFVHSENVHTGAHHHEQAARHEDGRLKFGELSHGCGVVLWLFCAFASEGCGLAVSVALAGVASGVLTVSVVMTDPLLGSSVLSTKMSSSSAFMK